VLVVFVELFIGILTESKNPTSYWIKLKGRLKKENQTVTNCHISKCLLLMVKCV